jgi:hypothetical protein
LGAISGRSGAARDAQVFEGLVQEHGTVGRVKKEEKMEEGKSRSGWRSLRLLCRGAGFSAVVFGVVVFGSMGASAQLRAFSADQIHTAGKRTTTGKIYASETAMRIESEQNGRPSITIVRLDRKVMWMVMPAQKMYMEMTNFGSAVSDMASSMQGAKVQRDLLGSEQVGAYHCDKYHVQTTYEGKVYTHIEWDAKELDGFAVKKQGEKGDWSVEYQNVHFGPQDPSLFEVPADYQKMSMGGMFKPQ